MSYTVPPPPPSSYQPQPARRKRAVWPWVLLAVAAVLLLCVVGGFVFAGTAVNQGVKAVEQAESERASDVKINGCKADSLIDVVTITYTITSSATTRETYMPQFEIVAPNGDVIGNAGDITGEIPPAGVYKGKAVGTLNEDVAKFTCRLVSA